MIKTLKPLIPELFILASCIYYWLASSLLNPIALFLLLVIGFQVFKQFIGFGLSIATIFIGLNLYMVLALISELSEFESVNSSFMMMLIMGGLYLSANLTAGFFMLIKYIKKANAKQLQKKIS